MLDVVRWVVFALFAYLGVGLVFAVAFAARGVSRIDPAARGTGWAFRLLIVPGSAALWPLLVRRWMLTGRARPRSTPRAPHANLADLPTDDGPADATEATAATAPGDSTAVTEPIR